MKQRLNVGIDEVGRGCWAGPLVAGAVVLRRPVDGLRDSKKLSKARREMLAAQIHAEALAVGLGWVWPEEIDISGITTAVKRAMELALAEVKQQLKEIGNEATLEIIIDGNLNYLPAEPNVRTLVKADDLIPAVSAASIVAKVARDDYMAKLGAAYEGYGFAQHVGYGTAAHRAALKLLGVSDIHRKCYKPIKALLLS